MASISHDGNGYRRILFKLGGKRSAIRLGKVSLRSAETVRAHVEEIVEAKTMGRSVDPIAAEWLRKLDDDLYGKLAGKGLVSPRQTAQQATLGAWTQACIAKHPNAKPATKAVWKQGRDGLIEFYGADKPIGDITAGAAEDYKLALIAEGLASYTVSKRLQFANKAFLSAVDHELIPKNPFAKVKIVKTMVDRKRFVTREETAKLLDNCPAGQDWRLIIVLARYGGLRCPSEVLSLTWENVDWAQGRITVTSPKTEHHAGGESRVMPLFPELRSELEAIWTPEAAGYIVDERFRQRAMGPNGWQNCNLRTTLAKIIKRAGLTSWARPFHNLRSSRQTELSNEYPSHVVCAWLGNSPDVAREHYLQVTDEHYAKAAQIAAQTTAGQTRQEATADNPKSEKPCTVASSRILSSCSVEAAGIETPHTVKGVIAISPQGGAQDGAHSHDADLQAVIDAWPRLSEGIRDAIVTLAAGPRPAT